MNQILEINEFFRTLFDPGEKTNFAINRKHTEVLQADAVEVVDIGFESFCINPLDAESDRNPYADYHHAKTPRRADCNVTVYRNVLIECDDGELRDQYEYVNGSGLPFSTCCYSGGKSLHFIISLETPLQTKTEYQALVKRILSVLQRADQQNLNPSRLSRFPYHQRVGGSEQTLWEVKGRITNDRLERWLVENGSLPELASDREFKIGIPRYQNQRAGLRYMLSPWTKQLLMFGAPPGERNKRLFMAACDCFEQGMDIDEVNDTLLPALDLLGSDFSMQEFRSTIRSAQNRARR